MPVNSTVQLEAITQNCFQEVDYITMGAAFKIHNKLGRLLDESAYQEALRQNTEKQYPACFREVELEVRHKSFTKKYYLDLLIDNGAIYEIKTTNTILPTHESQLLNYLLMCGLQHGKIINFRESSVTSRYVSTTLLPKDRKNFTVVTDQWLSHSDHCSHIPTIIEDLLEDLGTHLEVSLYREALHHLISTSEDLMNPVEIILNSTPIGHQKHYLLNETTALHISSLKSGFDTYKNHLLRILKNTRLQTIQWINFGGKIINCTTLQK